MWLKNNSMRTKTLPHSGQMNTQRLDMSSSVKTSSPWEFPVLDKDRELSCSSSQLAPTLTHQGHGWLAGALDRSHALRDLHTFRSLGPIVQVVVSGQH